MDWNWIGKIENYGALKEIYAAPWENTIRGN